MTTGKQSGSNALPILAAGGLAGLVASLLNRKPVAGAGVELPPEVLTALAALVANSATTVEQLQQVLQALGVSGAVGQNPNEIVVFSVVPTAINQAQQFPEYLVALDKDMLIRAYPANVGNVFVGNTKFEAENINSSWLLQPNEVVGYKIHNTKQLWISSLIAGDGVMVTFERRP